MSGDNNLSQEQRRVLASVLDEIIPPSGDGKLPGAGAIGVGAYVEEALRAAPDLFSMIAQGLSELDEQARARNPQGFPALPRPDKVELLNQQGFVLPLTLHACAGYYQDDRVVEALGLEARPPHPQGHQMEGNDFELLDGVRRRERFFRQPRA